MRSGMNVSTLTWMLQNLFGLVLIATILYGNTAWGGFAGEGKIVVVLLLQAEVGWMPLLHTNKTIYILVGVLWLIPLLSFLLSLLSAPLFPFPPPLCPSAQRNYTRSQLERPPTSNIYPNTSKSGFCSRGIGCSLS